MRRHATDERRAFHAGTFVAGDRSTMLEAALYQRTDGSQWMAVAGHRADGTTWTVATTPERWPVAEYLVALAKGHGIEAAERELSARLGLLENIDNRPRQPRPPASLLRAAMDSKLVPIAMVAIGFYLVTR